MQIESTTSVKHEKERDKDKDKEKEIGFLPEYSHFMACVPSPIVFPSSFLSVSSKPQSDDQNEPLLSAEEANARLRQCVATLAQQAGFEGALLLLYYGNVSLQAILCPRLMSSACCIYVCLYPSVSAKLMFL